jgi:hypothetical protein
VTTKKRQGDGMKRIGIGGKALVVGGTFATQASDEWQIGTELVTWAGYRVRVTSKRPTNNFGWKYEYTLQVLAAQEEKTDAAT